jgi:hypothetical protein
MGIKNVSILSLPTHASLNSSKAVNSLSFYAGFSFILTVHGFVGEWSATRPQRRMLSARMMPLGRRSRVVAPEGPERERMREG